jgi:AraC-like DNA-binding protein
MARIESPPLRRYPSARKMNRLKLDPSVILGTPRPDITVMKLTGDECHFNVHSEAGTGSFSKYVFPHAALNVASNRNREDFIVEEDVDKPLIWFHFTPSGSIVHHLDGKRQTVTHDSSSNLILFRRTIEYEIRKDVPNASLVIVVSPDFLMQTLGGEKTSALALERMIFRGEDDNILIHGGEPTPSMRMIVHEIMNAPFQGPLKRLYIEGKTYELMALRLAQLEQSSRRAPIREASLVLRGEDIERIRRAKELLADRMEDPPSIADLARLAGINEFKLKNGFKKIFGETIFGFLRGYRLETAKSLIETRDMNVAEIALEVGYRNPAHFARAFRLRYGVNPGRLLSQKRKRCGA